MYDLQLNSHYYFGPDALNGLVQTLKKRAFKNVLLLYGRSSLKKQGIHDQIITICKDLQVNVVEYSGISPNPRDIECDDAVNVAIKNNVDAIIAAGGGSVIDAAKVIATLTTNRDQFKNSWEYVVGNAKLTASLNPALPIIAIVTISATGSENNAGSVITNWEKRRKQSVYSPSAIPISVILNPDFTKSVDPWQTASGAFDIFMHGFEQFFQPSLFPWIREYLLAQMRLALKYGPIAVEHPDDYEARATLMFTSSFVLNPLAAFHRLTKPKFEIHALEHALSGIYDVTHGAGLALIAPYYVFYCAKHDLTYGHQVQDVGQALFQTTFLAEIVTKLQNFIKSLRLPLSWHGFSSISTFSDFDIELLVNHVGDRMDKDKTRTIFRLIQQNALLPK